MKFNDFLNEQLKNEELKKEYDKLTPEYEIIAAIIKARNEKGLTQLELAKTIGTDQSRISKLEKGTPYFFYSKTKLNFKHKKSRGQPSQMGVYQI